MSRVGGSSQRYGEGWSWKGSRGKRNAEGSYLKVFSLERFGCNSLPKATA